MKFWEAMKALDEGKRIRCVGWRKGGYMDAESAQTEFNDISYQEAFNNEWEVYEEPQKTYTFMEVVRGLKEGRRFRRNSWKQGALLGAAETQEILGFMRLVNQQGLITTLFLEDFEATDWIEVR